MRLDDSNLIQCIDPCELAMLPMIRLSPEAEPSETYCGSDLNKLDPAYHDVVNSGLWSYQLYTYLELLQQLFGNNIRYEVQDWLLDMLNANDLAGDRLETVFTVIEQAINASRSTFDTGTGMSCVSAEMSVALALLLDLPESPDFSVSSSARCARIRIINADVDQYFAAGLRRAHHDVYAVLLPVLERLVPT